MTTDEMKQKLGTMLTEHRLIHSLGVMQTAGIMAERFGADRKKAELAGLLHDCAKQIDREEQQKMCRSFGLVLDEMKYENTALLHAELGAELMREEFGVCDEEVLDAVRCHTLGKENMTTLEKILYLADIIEPNRDDFNGLAQLRALCEEDLDSAVLYGLELTIAHINRKGRPLHTQTICAERFYRHALKKEDYHMTPLSAEEKAKTAVRAMDRKRGKDLSMLHVADMTILADYFVLCTADSATQVKALGDAVEDELEKRAVFPVSREGKDGMTWLLLDYGDVIVHIFYKEMREFYGIDKIWADAPKTDISDLIEED